MDEGAEVEVGVLGLGLILVRVGEGGFVRFPEPGLGRLGFGVGVVADCCPCFGTGWFGEEGEFGYEFVGEEAPEGDGFFFVEGGGGG